MLTLWLTVAMPSPESPLSARIMDSMNFSDVPRAGYDDDGNIVIFQHGKSAEAPKPQQPKKERSPKKAAQSRHIHPAPQRSVRATPNIDAVLHEWRVVAEDPKPKAETAHAKKEPVHTEEGHRFVSKIATATSYLIAESLKEGQSQLEATRFGALHSLRDAWHALRKLPRHAGGAWKAANKPRLAPWNRPRQKPHSKATLFVIDTIRFGGTFAGIFVTLFVAINYQSFWQIARAQLALGDETHTEQALEAMVSNASDSGSPSAAAALVRKSVEDGAELVSYLPRVGPYENRLVIPKIGKNVPIVVPSMDALMREDWKQFEEDVQAALHHGVVHYPGSARPGQAGNFFVTGHSSYYPWDDGLFKDVFARLNDLDIGDTYSVYYGGDLHSYKVIEKKEVRPSDTSVLDQPAGRRLSTLMTCTPVGTTLRRLIIVAEEIDPATGAKLHVGEHTKAQDSKPMRLEALPI